MVRMALKLWKLTLEPYQSFSENDAPADNPFNTRTGGGGQKMPTPPAFRG